MSTDPTEPGLPAPHAGVRPDLPGGVSAPRSRREARMRAQAGRPAHTAPAASVAPTALPAPEREAHGDGPTTRPQPGPAGADDAFDAAVHALFSRDTASGAHRARHAATSHGAQRRRQRASARARGRRHPLRRVATAIVSISAVVAVGLLTVSLTLPADAVAAPQTQFTGAGASAQSAADVTGGGDSSIQAYVASADVTNATGRGLDRSAGYSTTTVAKLDADLAGSTGIQNFSNAVFTNNPLCPVQWPFAVGVPISYGFGPRPGEFHEGVDFTPGAGAHVQAIAAGTVRVASQSYQGYGVAVIIDHVIDGQHWASLYGHMEYGSLQVHAGETVKVGQYIGRTGDTGHSFGAHTHVEIREDGVTPIDPLPWLRAHNQC